MDGVSCGSPIACSVLRAGIAIVRSWLRLAAPHSGLTSLVRVGDLGWHQIRVSGRSVGARGPSALWGGGIGDARSRRARASSIPSPVERFLNSFRFVFSFTSLKARRAER